MTLAAPASSPHEQRRDGAARRPLRVLHVVAGMNRGGVETWLMNVLRAAGRDALHMDFLVHETAGGAYDEEIRRLGSDVIPCPAPGPLAFAKNFAAVMRARGPYDVVHSHVHAYSGWVLRQAHRAGVPVRVAHSHTDRSNVAAEKALKRRVYGALMRHLIRRHATAGVGVSEASAAGLFGAGWKGDPRWRVVYLGINVAAVRAAADDGAAARAELALPPDAEVVGHVGNLLPVKNHDLLLAVAAEMLSRRPAGAPPLRFLLVGDGPLRGRLEARAAALGIGHAVTFAGTRPDVPRMLAAMDAFVFPSLWEGLPLSVVEAQAAGLGVVLSDRVTPECVVLPERVWRLPPDAPAGRWAEACAAALKTRDAASAADALARVEGSRFNMDRCLRELQALYEGAAGRGG